MLAFFTPQYGIATGVVILLIGVWMLYRAYKYQNINQVIKDLLKTNIDIAGKPVSLAYLLYYDRNKLLPSGMVDYNLTPLTKKTMAELSKRNIVNLVQIKEPTFDGENVRDRGYYVLTNLGIAAIAYLEKHPQVFHKKGYQT